MPVGSLFPTFCDNCYSQLFLTNLWTVPLLNKSDSHLIVYLQALTVNFIYLMNKFHRATVNSIKILFKVCLQFQISFFRIWNVEQMKNVVLEWCGGVFITFNYFKVSHSVNIVELLKYNVFVTVLGS